MNSDYNPGPYDISFTSGDIKYLLNISINDDFVLERNEEFILNIDPILLPNRVSIGSVNRTIVTIIDDDRE